MIQTILFLHILAGTAALGAAGLALGSAKGGRLHRRAGGAFVAGMMVAGVSALVLAVANPSGFLFAVAVFTLFLVFSGWRAGRLRDGRARWPDHAAGAAMTAAGLGMLGWGLQGLGPGQGAQPAILIVFGAIGLTLALADWRDWRAGPVTGKPRIVRHLSRMMAGTIAAVTAAGVVNLGFLPDLVVWLGPTVLITPVIFWWAGRVLRAPARP